MALALFDLDNTLLNGDSDHSWGLFLAEIGAVDAVEHQAKQDNFYQQYKDGTLDIMEFCEFQFKVFTLFPLAQLQQWHDEYMQTIIEPMIVSGKAELIEEHKIAGDQIIIITATNDFVTAPIAKRLGVETLIATRAEFIDGKFTGKVAGTPCFRKGKVQRLEQWLVDRHASLEGSFFYSDSINDLPLLELVDTPIAVTPDDKLRLHAKRLHWQIID
ncbi:MAG: HAD superfamily hydrolase (TIGR01490 family) [Cryomorphaceae bacterium]